MTTTPEEEVLETTTLSTQPAPVREPSLGVVGMMRWGWRQLTSMRTALFLLFLLALAAVPGGILPQRGQNPIGVRAWIEDNPTLGPLLDRLSLFDVYAAPWFAATYLLLLLSLAGCVLPRTRMHWRAMRAKPPLTPRNLSRLPVHRSYATDDAPADVLEQARSFLQDERYRVNAYDGSVAAEKGYLRETGNLVFHAALLVLLVGVGMGSLLGMSGSALVIEGTGFANTPARFDVLETGRMYGDDDFDPLSFQLEEFRATYEESGAKRGEPRTFEADLVVRDTPDAAERLVTVKVNDPLVVGGTKVFLTGHGYAPRFTVTDGNGDVVLSEAIPFLPQDGNFSSEGVVKVPDARPDQLGFRALFLPTAAVTEDLGPHSTFPAPIDPAVFLASFRGDLGLDSGRPQSVYSLDAEGLDLEQLGLKALRVGETYELEDGAGSITFDGWEEFATFQVAEDPGKELALWSIVVALAGLLLSLGIRRRRLWVKATTADDGATVVEVAGLARTEAGDLDGEVEAVVTALRKE
ncbi:MAG: cytochrome c biogenesis protein ResB [Candidatus Nanopelagicales bacterium]